MSNLEIKALIAISIGLCFGYIKGGVFYICHVLNTVMKQQGNFLSLFLLLLITYGLTTFINLLD